MSKICPKWRNSLTVHSLCDNINRVELRTSAGFIVHENVSDNFVNRNSRNSIMLFNNALLNNLKDYRKELAEVFKHELNVLSKEICDLVDQFRSHSRDVIEFM